MQLVAKSIAKNIGLQLIHFVPSCNKIFASTRQVRKVKKLSTYLSKHLNSQSQLQRNNSRAKSLALRKSSVEKPRHLLTTRHSKSSSGYIFQFSSLLHCRLWLADIERRNRRLPVGTFELRNFAPAAAALVYTSPSKSFFCCCWPQASNLSFSFLK